MKRILFYCLAVSLLLASACSGSDQNPVHQSFENLAEIELPNTGGITVKYDPEISHLIVKQHKDLDSDYNGTFQLMEGGGEWDGCDANTWIVMKTKLNRNSDTYYYVTFSICSSDWEFYLYEEGNQKPIADLYAVNLILPGSGSVYTSGHMGNYNARRKFQLSGDTLVEVTQPYYYVGLKSKTLKTVHIYQTKECQKLIATLPPNYEIEVLLAENPFDPSLYLVRTSFGLTGWAKLEASQSKSTDVEGLFYNND